MLDYPLSHCSKILSKPNKVKDIARKNRNNELKTFVSSVMLQILKVNQ